MTREAQALSALVDSSEDWRVAVGVVAGMAGQCKAELDAAGLLGLCGWWMDGCPVGGRGADEPALVSQRARVGRDGLLWATLMVLDYRAPLTKRGQPSRAKVVLIRESFQAQARESLADPSKPAPLTARQLRRALEWHPMPRPVGEAAQEARAAALGITEWAEPRDVLVRLERCPWCGRATDKHPECPECTRARDRSSRYAQ